MGLASFYPFRRGDAEVVRYTLNGVAKCLYCTDWWKKCASLEMETTRLSLFQITHKPWTWSGACAERTHGGFADWTGVLLWRSDKKWWTNSMIQVVLWLHSCCRVKQADGKMIECERRKKNTEIRPKTILTDAISIFQWSKSNWRESPSTFRSWYVSNWDFLSFNSYLTSDSTKSLYVIFCYRLESCSWQTSSSSMLARWAKEALFYISIPGNRDSWRKDFPASTFKRRPSICRGRQGTS